MLSSFIQTRFFWKNNPNENLCFNIFSPPPFYSFLKSVHGVDFQVSFVGDRPGVRSVARLEGSVCSDLPSGIRPVLALAGSATAMGFRLGPTNHMNLQLPE